MKNRIVAFCIILTSLSLTAFTYMHTNNSASNNADSKTTEIAKSKVYADFFYDVGPRFGPIKKVDINKATSILDLLPAEDTQDILSYQSVSVIIVIDERRSDIRETGFSDALTDNQIQLLRSSDYSTNFVIRAEYLELNTETNKLEENSFTPHLTIVPEKQAEYEGGKDTFIEYLRQHNKSNTANLNEDKLQAAKLYFTVATDGSISNVKLDRTSGYIEMDKTMIELLTRTTGKWQPAINSMGEKVEQELVVSFGMVGC